MYDDDEQQDREFEPLKDDDSLDDQDDRERGERLNSFADHDTAADDDEDAAFMDDDWDDDDDDWDDDDDFDSDGILDDDED